MSVLVITSRSIASNSMPLAWARAVTMSAGILLDSGHEALIEMVWNAEMVTLAGPCQEENKRGERESAAIRTRVVPPKPDGTEKMSVCGPAQLDRTVDDPQIWKGETGCHSKVKLRGERAV